ncbi:MAG TPA: MFS transporter [Candidatus Saccharimonadales bacterium]|nr:MFS transporter [Candidatus Saccharimonadales bacterium]
MERRTSLILLSVLGAGVFLSGLELMVTAVALPSILANLSDWTQLRQASWIINGYLAVYVITMPLAGRLSDLWGTRRLFLLALLAFTIGSLLAGRAQTLDELIAARLIQALGGGTLVPVATAAAAHLFEGNARPKALGVIGGLTFLGMAAGPFVGSAILDSVHAGTALANHGITSGPLYDALAASWRWVFYVNVPIGIVALAIGWAASSGWETPRHTGRVDFVGALLFSVAVGALLIGLTLMDGNLTARFLDPTYPPVQLFIVAVVSGALAVVFGLRRRDPFLDVRLFRSGSFSSAALVSLLTGYGFATAIVGGAVFVDRVLYGGADQQRVALGALAGATAIGALGSGFAVRVLSLRWVTLLGLLLSGVALWRMSTWSPSVRIGEVGLWMALFGLGFGLTVTPRSTAAVEAVGREHFGMASATVTVARMIGMAVALAILVAYGSTTIDRLRAQIYATPDSYKQFLPPNLRDRPLKDGLVVQALEMWASQQAGQVLVGLFLVAGVLTVVAIPPSLALRRRRATGEIGVETGVTDRRVLTAGGRDGTDDSEPTFAL